MQRIAIIGCSGSGKSTLARALGAKLGLPVHHLDALYWQPGWRPHPDEPAFHAHVRALTAEPRWIIDGGFTAGNIEQRLGRADTVILFDLPTAVCLWRAFRRYWQYMGEKRPDAAPGCVERLDPEFFQYILTYRWRKLSKVEGQIAAYFPGTPVRLRNGRDVAALLDRAA